MFISIIFSNQSDAQKLTVHNGVAVFSADTTIGPKFQIPESWNKVIIKKGVTITGSFYMPKRTAPIEIAGESRETSVIQGNGKRPTDDGIKGRSYSAIRCDKDPDLYVHDLKITKPMKFHIHGGFGNVTVERCNMIAGTETYTTDGIHGGIGKTVVKDCYIDVYDDALYTNECKLVENTTIVHNKNGGPFMTSWGGSVPLGSVCTIRNCTVIDNSATDYNHGIVSWAGKGKGPETMTLKFEGTFNRKVNPGKKESVMYTIGRPGKEGLSNATLKIEGSCPLPKSIEIRGNTNSKIEFVNCNEPESTVKPDKKQILAQIEAHDKAVHIFDDWMRDPYITIGPDGFYYLTCTQYTENSEGIKMPVYKSADLADWKFVGFPYSMKDGSIYNLYLEKLVAKNKDTSNKFPDSTLKLWAPEMHFINGRWVVLHTSNAGIGNLVLAPKGKELKGPFTDWGKDFGAQHDPTLFVDDDKSIWMISKCAELTPLKNDLSGYAGKSISINPSNRKMGHEGAAILKIGGKYVFYGTAWSTDNMRKGTYNLYYCVSDKLEGPYGERKFLGRFLGHGTIFKDKKGRWWCTAFYNANVPPLTEAEIKTTDFSKNAYTINKQGLTLVPLDVKIIEGQIMISAKDPLYQFPGKEEVQVFE